MIALPAAAEPAYTAAVHIARDIGVRPAGSAAELRTMRYAAAAFRAGGMRTAMVSFRLPRGGTSHTAVGQLDVAGTRCLRLVIAHGDSSNKGPGANDNASGTGVVVALAAELRGATLPCDVWLAVDGAEERFVFGSGTHLGAGALVRRLRALRRTRDVQVVYDLDEVGRGTRFWLRSPVPRPRAAERRILRAARAEGVTVKWVHDSGSGNSDERELNLAGMPAAVMEGWRAIEPCRELACDTWRRLQPEAERRARRIAFRVLAD